MRVYVFIVRCICMCVFFQLSNCRLSSQLIGWLFQLRAYNRIFHSRILALNCAANMSAATTTTTNSKTVMQCIVNRAYILVHIRLCVCVFFIVLTFYFISAATNNLSAAIRNLLLGAGSDFFQTCSASSWLCMCIYVQCVHMHVCVHVLL